MLTLLRRHRAGYSTGMPKQDIVLATSVSTAIATMTMGLGEFMLSASFFALLTNGNQQPCASPESTARSEILHQHVQLTMVACC